MTRAALALAVAYGVHRRLRGYISPEPQVVPTGNFVEDFLRWTTAYIDWHMALETKAGRA